MDTDLSKLDSKISSIGRGNRMDTFYVVFRQDMVAVETIRFTHRRTRDRMLVDCGEDGYPIAAQVISADGIEVASSEDNATEDNATTEEKSQSIVHALFVLATEMMRHHEANNEKKGARLIESTVSYVQRIPRNAMNLQLIG